MPAAAGSASSPTTTRRRTITGTQFGDFMFDNSVGGQAQTFHGGGGNDVIMSGAGADTLDGGTGHRRA